MTWSPSNYTDACLKYPNLNSCQSSILTLLSFVVHFLNYSVDTIYKNVENDKTFNTQTDEYDFIIVGGGTAGCVVANRLSEIKNWKILLLEAGDEEPAVAEIPGLGPLLKRSSISLDYTTEPEPVGNGTSGPRKRLYYPRGKVMGGTSTINAMWYVRGNKQDFDEWGRDWSWQEVLPYFKKSEDARDSELLSKSPEAHGTNGYLTVDRFPHENPDDVTFLNAWKELGLDEVDYNDGVHQIGVARAQFANINGARRSTNGAFIRGIRGQRSNLVIRSNAQVTRIILDKHTKRATGVVYTSRGDTMTVRAKKEVILSAGVIDSPKLLMLSGIGPADHLRSLNINAIVDLPVGKNLKEHVKVQPVVLSSPNVGPMLPSSQDLRNDMIHWLDSREGPLSSIGISHTIAFHQTKFEKRPGVPDVSLFPSGSVAEKPGSGSASFNFVPWSYLDHVAISVVGLAPKSQGYVKLNRTDPLNGQPEIRMNLLNDPQDVKVMMEGVRFARKIVNTKALKSRGFKEIPVLGCEKFEIESDEYLECIVRRQATVGHHAVGTCSIGSVVDSRLKVHGVDGLRVIDGSIMPKIIRGNPMAATIMIGERASDLIKEDYNSTFSRGD